MAQEKETKKAHVVIAFKTTLQVVVVVIASTLLSYFALTNKQRYLHLKDTNFLFISAKFLCVLKVPVQRHGL